MDRNACVEPRRLSHWPRPEPHRRSRPRSAREASHLALIERAISVTALRITELEGRIALLNAAGLDARADEATLGLIRKSLLAMQRSKIEALFG
jgi:hypothetical protein